VLAVRVSIGVTDRVRVTATVSVSVRDNAWVSVRVSVDHTPIAAVVRPESSFITFGADRR
jgi:hypothetical protein